MMYYTIYKTTNLVNNKFYIGKHKTKSLDDNYLGSGKLLKRAIQKHGIENFKKELLHIFDNETEMNAKEKELVVLSENSYNLCEGGHGGFGYINKNGFGVYKKARKAADKSIFEKYGVMNPSQIAEVKEKMSNNMKEQYASGRRSRVGGNTGKKASSELKQKFSAIRKGKRLRNQNPMFNKKWITNGIISKPVNINELEIWFQQGFKFGITKVKKDLV